ncbi:hypothetical protein HYH33_06845 [Clostridium botulinum]|nr:hypothetical protein [Clostridium botulinum]MBY6813300.1 hypothetical protein [Clostridium botulinum]MBY6821966.1 hypothetical protein [Clostridium botulinum]
MFGLMYKLSVKFLIWDLKRLGINDLEIVIRSDGKTVYKRNKEREKSIKRTLDLIR